MLNYKVYYSLILYGMGTVFLFATDVFIGRNFSVDDFANWGYLKSTLFIFSALLVGGLDQAVIRHENHRKEILTYGVKRSIFLSVPLTILLFFSTNLGDTVDYVIIFLCFILYSSFTLIASWYRSIREYPNAQLATQLWKIIFGILVIATYILFTNNFKLSLVLLVSFLTACFFLIFYSKEKLFSMQKIKDIKNIKKLGNSFIYTGATLTIASHGELIILNNFSTKDSAAILFSHIAIFSPLVIGLNGFIGFLLGPQIRKRIEVNIFYIRKIAFLLFFYLITLSLASYFIGSYLFLYIYQNKFVFYPNIAILILITCIFRGLYIIPSSVTSVRSSTNQLNKLALNNWICLLIYLLISAIGLSLINFPAQQAALYMCAMTVLLWLSRLIIFSKNAWQVIDK